jgi:hypothetical protein
MVKCGVVQCDAKQCSIVYRSGDYRQEKDIYIHRERDMNREKE